MLYFSLDMLKAKSISIIIFIAFLANTIGYLPLAQADGSASLTTGAFRLPAPGEMVHLSPPFNPPILKGIKVHPDNPFRFDFILDKGDVETPLMASLRNESTKLIKYFLASLTIPEKYLWVNLSPYEKDRIIPQSFGLTEMGRDLLAEDYMLKQITASLIYPEGEVGKRFWKRIYQEAAQKYGTTNVAVNTFNKVWIVPDKAVVYENAKAGTAYVVQSKLKVMLEEDYLSLSKHVSLRAIASVRYEDRGGEADEAIFKRTIDSKTLREIVIPELTREINENKNFAQLRQVYHSLILATWYKKKIKDSILAQVYEDKNKIAGVEYNSPVILSGAKDLKAQNDTDLIYHRYLQAFKKGVYNYIKEDIDPNTQQPIPRKYFSGGENFTDLSMQSALEIKDVRELQNLQASLHALIVSTGLQDAAMQSEFPQVDGNDVVFSQSGLDAVLRGGQYIWKVFKKEVGEAKDYKGATKPFKVGDKTFDLVRKKKGGGKKGGGGIVFTLPKEQFNELAKLKGWPLQEELPEVNDNDVVFSGPGFGAVLRDGENIWQAFQKKVGKAKNYKRAKKPFKVRGKIFALVRKKNGSTIVFTLPKDKFNKFAQLEGWPLKEDLPRVNDNDVVFSGSGFGAVLRGGQDIWKVFKDEVGEAKDYKGATKPFKVGDKIFDLVRKERKKEVKGRGGSAIVFTLPKEQFNELAQLKEGWKLKGFSATKTSPKHLPENHHLKDEFPGWFTVTKGFRAKEKNRVGDAAMHSKGPGGIDLTLANKYLQTHNTGEEIKFHIDPAQLAQLQNAPGFVPVIINIQPLKDLRQFLSAPT